MTRFAMALGALAFLWTIPAAATGTGYQKYISQYAGDYLHQFGQGSGYQDYIQTYTGMKSGAQTEEDTQPISLMADMSEGHTDKQESPSGAGYQKYMAQYANDFQKYMQGQGKGGAQGGDYQKYMAQYANDFQKYMQGQGKGAQGGSQGGDYQKYMSQYADDFQKYMQGQGKGAQGGSQGGDYQKYMSDYAGKYMQGQGKGAQGGSQGGDYQKYMSDYAGKYMKGQGKGAQGGSQGGDYQKYMSDYAGKYMKDQSKSASNEEDSTEGHEKKTKKEAKRSKESDDEKVELEGNATAETLLEEEDQTPSTLLYAPLLLLAVGGAFSIYVESQRRRSATVQAVPEGYLQLEPMSDMA